MISPCGKYLVIGTKDANIYICVYTWDENEKREVADFIKQEEKIKNYGIHNQECNTLKVVDICFSNDSKWFACYDASHTVTLFKYGVDETFKQEEK